MRRAPIILTLALGCATVEGDEGMDSFGEPAGSSGYVEDDESTGDVEPEGEESTSTGEDPAEICPDGIKASYLLSCLGSSFISIPTNKIDEGGTFVIDDRCLVQHEHEVSISDEEMAAVVAGDLVYIISTPWTPPPEYGGDEHTHEVQFRCDKDPY